MRKYEIDYGTGVAIFYTDAKDVEQRFYKLARVCFGIRKGIVYIKILRTVKEKSPFPECEYLEFYGDSYIWRRDGAMKMISPFPDKEWDLDYCEECRFEEDE